MAEDKTKRKPIKKKVEKKKEGLDRIDFALIFRIRGKQGLFIGLSAFNKGGFCKAVNILDPEATVVVKGDFLQMLGDFIFATDAGLDDLLIEAVLQNLIDYKEANEGADVYTMDEEVLMHIMCPNYDEDQFKDYHCRKVLMFFKIIEEKLTQLDNEENAG